MKFGKKQDTAKIDGAIANSVNFELTIADMARRSERRAWLVAFSAIVMSLILAGGYFYFLPLKEKIPYLVMADAYTGTSSVARLREDFNNRSITTSEAINRSNVAHFVLARESYDVAIMRLRDWKTVYTMSGPDVSAEYSRLHANNDPASPFNTYGRDRAIRIRILSIVLLGGSENVAPKGATVRFQRSLFDKKAGVTKPLDSKIATLEFSYKSNLSMSEENRIENPLGFQVTSYRVDSDYAASPVSGSDTFQLPVSPDAATMPVQMPPEMAPDSPPAMAPQPGALVPGTQPPAPAAPSSSGTAVPPPAPATPIDNSNGASSR
jgi:type IV secretion system protein VirB8